MNLALEFQQMNGLAQGIFVESDGIDPDKGRRLGTAAAAPMGGLFCGLKGQSAATALSGPGQVAKRIHAGWAERGAGGLIRQSFQANRAGARQEKMQKRTEPVNHQRLHPHLVKLAFEQGMPGHRLGLFKAKHIQQGRSEIGKDTVLQTVANVVAGDQDQRYRGRWVWAVWGLAALVDHLLTVTRDRPVINILPPAVLTASTTRPRQLSTVSTASMAALRIPVWPDHIAIGEIQDDQLIIPGGDPPDDPRPSPRQHSSPVSDRRSPPPWGRGSGPGLHPARLFPRRH